MGEADPWTPCPRPGQPDQNQRKAGRDLRDLAETSRPTACLTETLEDLGETLRGLAETTDTTGIWPITDPYHGYLVAGRPLLQLTLKLRSVKLIHH